MRGRLLDSPTVNVTALAGGVGGAKLLVGLDAVSDLTAVVNVGDDDTIYGVHVSPDVDICTYWLTGIADTEQGWGISGDTFTMVDAFAALGGDAWFRLGDRDLATCLFRTRLLADGVPLSIVTDEIRRALGASAIILPASDDPLRTQIVTRDGRTLSFQEYFVKERQAPEVAEVMFAGVADAKPAPGVLDAIAGADKVLICPSNPLLSVGPILSLPGVRDALRDHREVVAVSPIVRGVALKGPADRIMRSTGLEPRASEVARLYADFVDTFVIDSTDRDESARVRGLGIEVATMDTIMTDRAASTTLARELVGA
jgi:LPPG:FO 2-phospho-L-lactate transferase